MKLANNTEGREVQSMQRNISIPEQLHDPED